MNRLDVDIFVREVAHGHEECARSDAHLVVRKGTAYVIVGPSKVPRHQVWKFFLPTKELYVRVQV